MTGRERALLDGLTNVGGFRDSVLKLRGQADDFCADKPYFVTLTSGARSTAKQLEYWQIGREKVSEDPKPFGTWKVTGKVVTKVRPGGSAHNFRAAVDVGFIDPHGPGRQDDEFVSDTQIDPTDPNGKRRILHPCWDWLMRAAEQLGIEAPGRRWGWDYGHLQIRGWRRLADSGVLIAVD